MIGLALLLLGGVVALESSNVSFVVSSEEKKKVHCFRTGSRVFCAAATEGPAKNERFATVLGIGPGRSGSSILARVLNCSPRVVVAVGVPCCGGETQFLTRPDYFEKGRKGYALYFERSRPGWEPPEDAVYYDKTPQFDTDPMAPFRAAVYLPRSLKLILTMRNPVDMDASQFYHFNFDEKMHYSAFVSERIEAWETHENCREKAFNRSVVRADDAPALKTIRSIYDSKVVSPETTSTVEALLTTACPRATDHLYMLGTHLYHLTLERWLQAFPPTPQRLLCVPNERLVDDPDTQLRRLFDFVGLSDYERLKKTIPPIVKQDPGRTLARLTETSFGLMREEQTTLLSSENNSYAEEALHRDIFKARTRLLDYLSSKTSCQDIDIIRSTCGFVPDYVHFRKQCPSSFTPLASSATAVYRLSSPFDSSTT